MSPRWLISAFVTVLLTITATASAQMQSGEIRKASLPLSPRMPIEIVVQDDRVGMDVPLKAGVVMLGGIPAPTFSSGDARTAQHRVAPLRELTGDLRLAEVLSDAIERGLDRTAFASEFAIEHVALPRNEFYLRRDRPPGKRIMVLEPRFGFSDDATALRLVVRLQIEDRIQVDGRSRARPQYVNTVAYLYTDPAIDAAEDVDARMALWQQRIADRDYAQQLLREALDPAIDMHNEAFLTRNDKVPRDQVRKQKIGGTTEKFILLREANGRRWIRSGTASVGPIRSIGPLPPRQ